MTHVHTGRRSRLALLFGLLGGLALVFILALLVTRPLAAAPAQVTCYATPNGGTNVYDSTDNANALRDAINISLNGGTVWVAGTCQGAIADSGTTAVARIDRDLTIIGYQYDGETWSYDPAANAVIDAQDGGRVIVVVSGVEVTLRNLDIVNGETDGGGGGLFAAGVATVENSLFHGNHSGNMGGAVASFSDLTIRNSQLISNTTVHHGGAIAARGAGTDLVALESVDFTSNRCTNAGGCYGGAISALHAVTVSGTTFVDNHTTGSGFASGGGAIYTGDELTITNSEFQANTTGAYGGALYTHGLLAITDSSFTNNEATLDGGAVWTSGTGTIAGSRLEGNRSGGIQQRGGAVYNNGALTVSTSEFYSNTTGSGAGIFNAVASALSVTGSTFGWNQGDRTFGAGGGVRNEGTFDVSDSAFHNNQAGFGGAIGNNSSMNVVDGQFTNNEARTAGAVGHSAGVATIASATFTGNRSVGSPTTFEQPGGGALSVGLGQMTVTESQFHNNSAAHRGGAIYNSGSFATSLLVEDSEIIANTAAFGGGVYAREDTTIRASRIFDNQATNGGALILTGQGDFVLTNNFIAGNEATSNGDTIYLDNVGTAAGTLDATHVTFVGAGEGTMLQTNGLLPGYDVELTNVIVSGYDIAVQIPAGVTDTVAIDGVLWHDVGTQTSGPGITVAHAYQGDPAFLDPANHDYHLLPATAAFDRGVPTSVTVDIDGDMRPYGAAPELGADELPLLMPDLVIEKTVVPTNPAPGAAVTYHLNIRNTGVGVVEDVVVSDVLPDELEVISVTSSDFSLPPGTATTWSIGDLAQGEEGTITIVARVLPSVSIGTVIVNAVTGTSVTEEATLINNEDSVTITVSSFRIYLPLIYK